MFSLLFLVSFFSTLLAVSVFIPGLKKAGIMGRDMHKPGKPEVPEMGGLAIVVGFSAGVLLAVALETFSGQVPAVDLATLLATLSTVLIVALVGILDDLIQIKQWVKALLPAFAALPLVAVRAGNTAMHLPLFGRVDFGVLYSLFLVPLGVTGAANGVNMLAGFNGLEVGMGIVATGALAFVARAVGATTSLIVLVCMLGPLLAVLCYNWYPARILVGDVGTLSIGAVMAAAVIIGNFEAAGAIVIVPYFVDFLIKAANRFPSTGWWGEYQNGKLYCSRRRPVGLCQWIMKLSGGIHERNLVLVLMGIEAVFGLVAILMFGLF